MKDAYANVDQATSSDLGDEVREAGRGTGWIYIDICEATKFDDNIRACRSCVLRRPTRRRRLRAEQSLESL